MASFELSKDSVVRYALDRTTVEGSATTLDKNWNVANATLDFPDNTYTADAPNDATLRQDIQMDDANLSFAINVHDDNKALFSKRGKEGQVWIYPLGTATGEPKYIFNTIVRSNYDGSGPVGVLNVTMMSDGIVTETTAT